MKSRIFLFAFIAFLMVSHDSNAQKMNESRMDAFRRNDSLQRKNIVKINVVPLIIGNLSAQYEYVLTPKSSFALGLSYFPGKDLSALFIGDSTSNIRGFQLSSWSITPEFRWYLSKKKRGARGMYIAPYFRYRNYSVATDIEDTNSGTGATVDLPVHISYDTYGLGVMFGIQQRIGKRFVFDYWIIGSQYGTSTLTVSITTDLRNVDKVALKKSLDSDIRQTYSSANSVVDNNGATVTISGLIYKEFRSGFAIGYTF